MFILYNLIGCLICREDDGGWMMETKMPYGNQVDVAKVTNSEKVLCAFLRDMIKKQDINDEHTIYNSFELQKSALKQLPGSGEMVELAQDYCNTLWLEGFPPGDGIFKPKSSIVAAWRFSLIDRTDGGLVAYPNYIVKYA